MEVPLSPVEVQGVALELEAEAVAHHAVRPVAGHQEGEALGALGAVAPAQVGRDAVLILLEIQQLDAEVGLHPVGGETTPHYGFGVVLRHHQHEGIV